LQLTLRTLVTYTSRYRSSRCGNGAATISWRVEDRATRNSATRKWAHPPPPLRNANAPVSHRALSWSIRLHRTMTNRRKFLKGGRSEQHTSELQSRENLGC